jgi:hypothetical protein
MSDAATAAHFKQAASAGRERRMTAMALLVPPQPPDAIALGDDGRLDRLRFRLWQLFWTAMTIFATVWIMLIGIPILSIVAIAVAKHILVAIYIMGMHTFPVRS